MEAAQDKFAPAIREEENREPDWSCPLCRLDWYNEPRQLCWASDRLTLPHTAMSHPRVTGGCAACAPRRATLTQLRRVLLLAELHTALLRQLLGLPPLWQPREEEVAADAAEALFLYMPDAFADAAREVIAAAGCGPLLWHVMKQDAGPAGRRPTREQTTKGGMPHAQ